MWDDLKRVVPLEFKEGHLSTKMRREVFKHKIGPTVIPFSVVCKLDRDFNLREVNRLKDNLKVLVAQVFDEDKKRTRNDIFKIVIKSLHSKQISGQGGYKRKLHKVHCFLPIISLL